MEVFPNQEQYYHEMGIYDLDNDLRMYISDNAQEAVKVAIRSLVYEHGMKLLYKPNSDIFECWVIEHLVNVIKKHDKEFAIDGDEFYIQEFAERFLEYKL